MNSWKVFFYSSAGFLTLKKEGAEEFFRLYSHQLTIFHI